MDATKSLLLSKTVWFGLAAVLLGVLPLFGVDTGNVSQSEIGDSLYEVAVAVCGAGAIVGRIVATRKIELPPVVPSRPDGPLAVLFCLGLAVALAACSGGSGTGVGAYLADERTSVAEACREAANTVAVAAWRKSRGELGSRQTGAVDALVRTADPVCREQAALPPDHAALVALETALAGAGGALPGGIE